MISNENLKHALYVVSVFRSNLSFDENQKNHESVKALMDDAGNIAYKEVIGCYMGQFEQSFLIQDNVDFALDIAKLYEQECILELSAFTRDARLIYPLTQSSISIGVFTAVDKEMAQRQDNYTYDPMTGIYYITMKKGQ